MAYNNQTRITYDIAKTNGLPYFQVQLVEWAVIQSDILEPPSLTTEFPLPKNASLFGVSIDPASQIGSAQLNPGWDSLIGIQKIGLKGEKLPPNIIVKPGSPFIGLVPGPIILKATSQSIWDRAPNNQYWSAVDGEAKPLNIGNNQSDLVLDCWIRDPGPRGIPDKRPDVFKENRIDFVNPTSGDNLLAIHRISDRRRLSVNLALTARNAVPPDGTCDIRVSLIKASREPSVIDNAPFLTEHQVEPSIAGAYTTLTAGTPAGTLQVDIDDPEAEFLMIRGNRPAGGVAGYILRIAQKFMD